MKKTHFLTTILFTALLILPSQFNAQDILDVAPIPAGNINAVINGDTVAGGERAHPDRIYRLQRGVIYQVTEKMNINGNLNIIATDPTGDVNDPTNRPPVLTPAILPDNSSVNGFFNFIGEGAEIELHDLYLLNVRADQNWPGWSEGIRIGASNVSLKMRGVIMEAWSNVAINPDGDWHKIDIQDCVFRNNQGTGSWFGGQVFRGNGAHPSEELIFINNTFFANNSYLLDARGYDGNTVFEHNTCVYGIVNPFLTRQASHLKTNNNVFYSLHSFGGNPTHVYDGWFLNWPDTASSSIFRIRAQDSVSYWAELWGTVADGPTTISGPEAFVNPDIGVTEDLVDPTMRVSELQSNAYFWPQDLWDFIDAYNDTTTIVDSIGVPNGDGGTTLPIKRTIYKPTWISEYAQWTIDNLLPGLGVNTAYGGNMMADPGFDADVAAHISGVTNYIHEISTGTIDEETWHYYPESGNLYPPAWPLPENLAYSNAAMQSAGTDGFAMGDLNWFPDQKASWLTGVEKTGTEIPEEFELSQNYPNPFNPTTTFDFKLANSGNVKIVVFDMLGQEVKTLVNKDMNAGSYKLTWNGTDNSGVKVASGNYLLSLETNSVRSTRKMVLLK